MARPTKCTKSTSDNAVIFDFAHVGDAITVALKDFSKDTLAKLALHGISQKLGDSYASAESSEDAQVLFNALLKRLTAGEWTKTREGSSGGTRSSQLLQALVRATGKSIEDCADVLAGMDDDKKKALRSHPEVASALAAIKAELAATKADTLAKAAGDAPSLADLL